MLPYKTILVSLGMSINYQYYTCFGNGLLYIGSDKCFTLQAQAVLSIGMYVYHYTA